MCTQRVAFQIQEKPLVSLVIIELYSRLDSDETIGNEKKKLE